MALVDKPCVAGRQWVCGAVDSLEPYQGHDGRLTGRPFDCDQPALLEIAQYSALDLSTYTQLSEISVGKGEGRAFGLPRPVEEFDTDQSSG